MSSAPVHFAPIYLSPQGRAISNLCLRCPVLSCCRPERGACLGSAGYTTNVLDPSHPDNYRLNTITCLCPPTPKADKPLTQVGPSL